MRQYTIWRLGDPALRPVRIYGRLVPFLLCIEAVCRVLHFDVEGETPARRGLKDRQKISFFATNASTTVTLEVMMELPPILSRAVALFAPIHHFHMQQSRRRISIFGEFFGLLQ